MRHATPLAALETLERELQALAADVERPGAGIEPRLDSVLELVPVLGAAAQDPTYANEHKATVAAFERLRARQEALTARLERQLSQLRGELTKVTAGAEAARGYGGATISRLDRVG